MPIRAALAGAITRGIAKGVVIGDWVVIFYKNRERLYI